MTAERPIVEPQVGQRLPEVVVGLAGRRDAEPCARRVHRDPVEPVGGGERPGGLETPVDEVALGVERVGRQEPRDLARLPRTPLVDETRIHDPHPVGVDLRGAHGVGHVRHDLEGHPEPGVARQLEAEAPEVEDVLDASGEEHRHLEVVERDLGMGGQGRRLGLRIVAGQRQHAAVPSDASEVRVAKDVAAPVDTGRLAVPHAEHAVVARAPVQVRELAAEHGGGAEVLVHARDEDDLVLAHEAPVALDGLVQPAERRSPVPGDEGRRVEATPAIRAVLVEREADESLDAGHEDAARLEPVLHLEGKGVGGLQGRFHAALPSLRRELAVCREPVTRNAKGARRPPPHARDRPPAASVAAAPAPAAPAPATARRAGRSHEPLPALESEQGQETRHLRAVAGRTRDRLLPVHEALERPTACGAPVLVDRHRSTARPAGRSSSRTPRRSPRGCRRSRRGACRGPP